MADPTGFAKNKAQELAMPVSRYENIGPVDCTKGIDLSAVKGKSVIVTGGASGIGHAYVDALVKAGAYVTIGDLNDTAGQAIAAASKGRVQFVHCDVTSFPSQVSLFKAAIANSPHHKIDVVVANAGIAANDPLLALDPPGSEPTMPVLQTLHVNLTGAIYTARLACHYFQDADEGRDRVLVLQDSVAGYVDLPPGPQYSVAKFGLRALMRGLRHQLVLPGVRTNTICPCFIETPLMDEMTIGALKMFGVGFATKEDCASALLRIIADRSINGRAFGIMPEGMVPGGVYDLDMDDNDPKTVIGAYEQQTLRLVKPPS